MWQRFPVSVPPLVTIVLSIQQAVWQAPALHTWPAPQLVPSALGDQSSVFVPGLQIWQVFVFVTPLPTKAPLIQQPVWHVPPLHTWPEPQVAPLTRVVHSVLTDVGSQTRQGLVESAAPLA